jgi:pimeloyl-ACP methyl ester carboxylesterase
MNTSAQIIPEEVLLLHGAYWSPVWQPVLDGIAAAGLRSVAVDFPCFGRSGGELTVSETSVPRLSVWLLRFLEALGQRGRSWSLATTSAEAWRSI